MNHLEASQVCFGLILENKKSPQSFMWEDFADPYDDAVKYCQENPETWCKEDLVKIVAPSFIQEAMYAVQSMNGLGETTDWSKVMKEYADDMRLKDVLERTARGLGRGKQPDWLSLNGHIQSRVMGQATGLTRGCDIDISNYYPFKKSGYSPFDTILGGIPTDGPLVIYGLTGIGKSHLASKLLSRYLHEHKKDTGGVYTLEMSSEHWKWREMNMYPELEKVMDRWFVSGSVTNVDELIAEVSSKSLNMIVIDDINSLTSENSPSEFERVYKKIKEICRFLKIPVIVLAQPNRTGKKSDKFLSRYDIAWSGAAEDSAAMLIAIQRANELDLDYEQGSEPYPLYAEDHEYLIVYKSRDGWTADYPDRFPKKFQQRGPGAIILEPSKKLWEGTPLGQQEDEVGNIVSPGRLWQPLYVRRTIGKKNKKRSYDD